MCLNTKHNKHYLSPLNLDDFSFDLPEDLIAQFPLNRADSRLLYTDKEGQIQDLKFKQLLDCLPQDALLVFNKTRVYKARLKFYEKQIGKNLELFFLKDLGGNRFLVLMQANKKIKPGVVLNLPGGLDLRLDEINKDGERIFLYEGEDDFVLYDYLDQYGEVPLPPYISTENPNEFTEAYQSVFASEAGSVAAPTASLHFSSEIMKELKSRFKTTFLSLDVGIGTFAPLRKENLEKKFLHEETYAIPKNCSLALREASEAGRPIYAIGTTALRAIESLARLKNDFAAGEYSTKIFLSPGDNFISKGLVTNFHLPQSSLFILISAFIGVERAKKAYAHAIQEKYRFYSFGDACLFENFK